MTTTDLVFKKLALIETYLRELREHARPELIETDIRELRFVEHTLQVAIQAALDLASHIVSDDRLGEPASNRELFEILARHGWLDVPLAGALQRMAGFRNILVHGYAEVDPRVVKDVLLHHLGDLDRLIAVIRDRLSPGPA